MNEWIKIKDRLPEHESNCDIFTKDGYRRTDVLFVNYPDSRPHFYYDERDIILFLEDVTHWMPLPEDPKD